MHDSHNVYCDTSDSRHNILCLVCDAAAFVALVAAVIAGMSIAAGLDLHLAGVQ